MVTITQLKIIGGPDDGAVYDCSPAQWLALHSTHIRINETPECYKPVELTENGVLTLEFDGGGTYGR
jgi:hypothetical protein